MTCGERQKSEFSGEGLHIKGVSFTPGENEKIEREEAGRRGKLRTHTGTHRTPWGQDSDPLGQASYPENQRKEAR